MKVFSGYVLGVDNKKMYSIIIDPEEDKTYQMDCELEYVTENLDDVQAERKFNLSISEEGEMMFEFLDEKINENISVDDLKRNMGIDVELDEDEQKERINYIDKYIEKGDSDSDSSK